MHRWRGRWLVNGAAGPLVAIEIDPPARARVLGFPSGSKSSSSRWTAGRADRRPSAAERWAQSGFAPIAQTATIVGGEQHAEIARLT